MEELRQLLKRHGIGTGGLIEKWCRHGRVRINGEPAAVSTPVRTGDTVSVLGFDYSVYSSRDPQRLGMVSVTEDTPARITGRVRAHCGYHKCLTMYFRRVLARAALFHNPLRPPYRHFFHRTDEFYRHCSDYTIASLSGHALDLDRFDDIRVARVVRDPRDLLVSGYYYHKRSAEDWCDHRDPTDGDWAIVGGVVPQSLPPGKTLAEYLNEVTVEEGLLAELDFRRNHFDSMLQWPEDDPRVRVFRYEDIVGNERGSFRELFDFYGLSWPAKRAGLFYAARYSAARKKGRTEHIRDPSSGQWREHFTPRLRQAFNDRYGAVLERLGYATE